MRVINTNNTDLDAEVVAVGLSQREVMLISAALNQSTNKVIEELNRWCDLRIEVTDSNWDTFELWRDFSDLSDRFGITHIRTYR